MQKETAHRITGGRFPAFWERLSDDERRCHGEAHQSDQNSGDRFHTAVGDGTSIPRAEHAHQELLFGLLTSGFPGFDGEFDDNQYYFEHCKGDHDMLIHC
jgi:hypothetical protein